jgi:hypothetical protein
MHRHRIAKRTNRKIAGPNLTGPGAIAILTVTQNHEPEGAGNGLVPPVPFGSIVDELLSPAAAC